MVAKKFASYGVWLMLLCLANLDTSSCDVSSEKILGQFEVLREEFKELKEFVRSNTETTKHQLETQIAQLTEDIRSCLESTKQEVELNDSLSFVQNPCKTQNILCISNSHGADWIVVQQRIELESTSFNRTWNNYRDGFGKVGASSSFWLGLERLYQLTKNKSYEMLVEVTNKAGEMRFARYSQFKIGSEAEKYKLLELSGFSGTEQDANSFGSHAVPTDQMFSTYDSDNDQSPGDCASYWGGGWWWNYCGPSINLSGSWARSASWSDDWSQGSMKSTRMSIRERK